MDRRAFLALSSATAFAALGSAAYADVGRLSGAAERTPSGGVRLVWSGTRKPVTVLASSDPDAPASLMRVVAERVRSGRATAGFPASPRPYFLLETGSESYRLAERVLPLEGGRNFRDLGGYRGAGGRQVRWGRIYRSGVTSGLTAGDLTFLSQLGVRTVCDFRSTTERTREPTALASAANIHVSATDYELDYSGMAGLFAAQNRDEAIRAFAESYAGFSTTLAPQFTDMFRRLIRQETPLAFNCTAGKDRTGLASALILSALGVAREDVVADYALSETIVPPDGYLAALRNEGPAASSMGEAERAMFSRLPEAVVRVLMGTPPEVMQQTLARLDEAHGGPVGFITRELGITQAEIDYMQSVYLA